MEKLSAAILRGSPTALAMAKSLLTSPSLKCDDPHFFLYLEVVTHRQHGDAQVSESVIITAGGDSKKYIADNVAPGPWTWTLSGYISGHIPEQIGAGHIPDELGFVFPMTEPTSLLPLIMYENIHTLRTAFKNGSILTYKDIDCKIYNNVVIQSLDIEFKSDSQNRTPFTMVLKELNIMEAGAANVSRAEQLATPPPGSKHGEPKDLGMTTTREKKMDDSTMADLFGVKGYKK